jgi:hypothetical protein
MRCLPLVLCLAPSVALADALCTFDAFTDGTLPHDIAIHAGPSLDEPLIGIAPRGKYGTEYEGFGIDYSLVEMRQGWARVTNGRTPDREGTAPDGWIDGAYLKFVAQTEVVFAEPDAGSDVVFSSGSSNDWPALAVLLDCKGDWALITFDVIHHPDGALAFSGRKTGWVRGICANQWTTCDGTWGDWAKDHPATAGRN